MFEWFFKNIEAIIFALMVILLDLLFPVLIYLTVIVFLACVFLFCYQIGYEHDQKTQQTEEELQTNNAKDTSKSDSNNLKSNLDENQTKSPPKIIETESFPLCKNFMTFCDAMFFPGKKKSKSLSLTEAALEWDELFQIQMTEISLITQALKYFNRESDYILKQMEVNQKMHPKSRQKYFQTATEQTALIESRDRNDCLKLWSELQELINNYPKCTFNENPCLESIKLYAHERIEHHEKIIAIASVLLPNISSLLNEIRLDNDAPTAKNNG